ncbi:hypothetical protein [Nocardioides sp. REDSEA-S30_B4]|uniref:hypothetical protein n=1 Tax=Nocardioides sp. REDSEA-S30_B4 TaxID=1811552 RepID=UPI000A3F5166|nr:hypothetical protein [Nocardioides sp. REDSEA-S30_B4]
MARVRSNALSCIAISGSQQHLLVNSGAAYGTFRWVRGSSEMIQVGISYGFSSGTGTTGYILYRTSTFYRLVKQTASGSYTTLADTTGVTPAAGDVVEVVWNGNSHKVRVNGTERASATDSAYSGTWNGAFNISATHAGAWDELSHTSATA